MITLAEAYEEYFEDAERRGVRAIGKLKNRAAHVVPLMGATPIDEIATVHLRELQRVASETLSPGSVNGVLSILQAALNEAVRSGHLAAAPAMPRRLREPPPRRGFLEPSDFGAIAAELDEPARSIFEFSYLTGWRKNEVVSLTWSEVSLEGGYIELATERSKNGESRTLPLAGRMAEIIHVQAGLRNGSAYVFHREGKRYPLPTFSDHYRQARKRAGREHIRFHDTRRTAARNLVRAGVPERIAMQVTGHSRQMFDRYNVTSEKDLQVALERISDHKNLCLTSDSVSAHSRYSNMARHKKASELTTDTARFVARKRKALGFTQEQLAEAMGVTREAVVQWETGERGIREPFRKLLIFIAEKHLQETSA